jgi:hypothetical protein
MQICCVRDCFGGLGGGTLGVGVGVVVTGVMVAAVGGDMVDSRAFMFERFELVELLFLGQLRVMWPCVQQWKHRPSAWYLECSSSVNFRKGTVIFAESTSMGMCWLFDKEWDVCWFPVWYVCWSHDWF